MIIILSRSVTFPIQMGIFLAQFKLVNTAEYTYLQENLHYTTTTEPL